MTNILSGGFAPPAVRQTSAVFFIVLMDCVFLRKNSFLLGICFAVKHFSKKAEEV